MAALLFESLPENKTSILTAVRVIEVALLSSGLIYTILVFKGAVFPSSYDFMLSSLRKPVSFLSSWLSSPFYICIFMNIIVILIAVSSLFHHPKMDSNGDIEDGGGDSNHEDYDLQSALAPSLSPPPAPPPMQNNQKRHLQERKPKDIAVAAPAAAATVASATTKGSRSGGKLTTATTSLKIQEDATGEERVVECQQQAVFSDFSRLEKAKEIEKAQKANDGEKIRTTKQGTRDTNVAKVNDHDSVQAIFAHLPKFGEAKEIKKAHSKQVKTIQNAVQQNQTNKQLETADVDEDNDTMEATWRAIEGGTKPQEKQLKKSKTLPQAQKLVIDQERENIQLPMPSSGGAAVVKELRKSMTFNDTVSIERRGGLRRDPSMNLEEFNQRVEAFIQQHNHELRLQRQESDQRYLDMINNRGL